VNRAAFAVCQIACNEIKLIYFRLTAESTVVVAQPIMRQAIREWEVTMPNLDVAVETLSYLDYVEGETMTDKILSLIAIHFATQLQVCEREISQYELKYGMTFVEFAALWEKDEIPERWSHPVERDYMEWEGLEAERKNWLSLFSNLPPVGREEVLAILTPG